MPYLNCSILPQLDYRVETFCPKFGLLFDIGRFVIISFLWLQEIKMRSVCSRAFPDHAAR